MPHASMYPIEDMYIHTARDYLLFLLVLPPSTCWFCIRHDSTLSGTRFLLLATSLDTCPLRPFDPAFWIRRRGDTWDDTLRNARLSGCFWFG